MRNRQRVGPLKGNSSTLIVDEALTWLKSGKSDQPFMLFVWFHAPHEIVATPEEWTKLYADIDDEGWGLTVDPRGWLSVVRANPGNAAEGLGVGSGDLIWLRDGS